LACGKRAPGRATTGDAESNFGSNSSASRLFEEAAVERAILGLLMITLGILVPPFVRHAKDFELDMEMRLIRTCTRSEQAAFLHGRQISDGTPRHRRSGF